jgi:general secretion pathway protein C
MLSNFGRLLIHFIGAGLACAQLAYWTIGLMTPPPAPAPAPMRAAAVRDPDPVLLARAFGQVELAAPAAIGNIQVAGVYAAGRDSAAVFVVGDKPAKAVRLGQEVAPGSTLVEVDAQGVTLESGGVRRQLRVPNPPPVATNQPAPAHSAAFERLGKVLTAPTLDTPPTTRPLAGRAPAIPTPPRLEPAPGSPGRPGLPTTQ